MPKKREGQRKRKRMDRTQPARVSTAGSGGASQCMISTEGFSQSPTLVIQVWYLNFHGP